MARFLWPVHGVGYILVLR